MRILTNIPSWVEQARVPESHEGRQEIKLVPTPRDTKTPVRPDGRAPGPLIEGGAVEGEAER
jgi:hypothetical protein